MQLEKTSAHGVFRGRQKISVQLETTITGLKVNKRMCSTEGLVTPRELEKISQKQLSSVLPALPPNRKANIHFPIQ